MILSKTQIQETAGLAQIKNRFAQKAFLVEGVKMVDELLQSSYNIKYICALKEWIAEHDKLNNTIPVYEITEIQLKKISNLSTPNQVVAVVEIPDVLPDITTLYSKLSLVLDDIKDPGNMGTIIRIADWFGIENIFCSHESVDIYNPKVVQATMGSLFRVNVFYFNIEKLLKESPSETQVYGTLLTGKNIYTQPLEKKGFIVIGSESHGISSKIQKLLTQQIHIPRFGENAGAESLNAAVATAIVCSEFCRRTN